MLRCELAAIDAQDPWLRARLHNTGARTLYLLRWGSPWEGAWFAPMVRVWRDDVELPYQGAQAKRGEPERDDYLRLRPGESTQAALRLADAFDLTAPGSYRLQAAWTWHDVMSQGRPPRPRSQHQSQAQDCGPALNWRR
ncbi:hypothetical protein HNQ51_003502 [Inhella inkyongensis]|uniref:Uncharacterized protein n=1 Tax=Inhella inkyongensis TaxID=392593 RepID=A0A840SCX0_9BURK|nr:protease [Inhella inkyongensis]MBB5206159.1 hypothetical protein [Inhella inkyongensis]